jgi:hypothetical protein
MKIKISLPKDFDITYGPIDENYYSKNCDKYKRFVKMYNQRNDGLVSLNSELNNIYFKEKMASGFAKEAYRQQARALYLIISEIINQ